MKADSHSETTFKVAKATKVANFFWDTPLAPLSDVSDSRTPVASG
jgi:hypothetical protein